jgi:hypothetical protein
VKGFTYKSYSFIDKDPIIDEVRAVFDKSGANYAWIEANSGVCTATLYNWFDGATKRPQAATVNAVLRSMGYKLGVVADKPVIVELPAKASAPQREPSTRHIVNMAKYRRG